MIESRKRKTQRRNVRYTFLLSQSEIELAKELARCEVRTLPDFLRAHIYERARELGMKNATPDRDADVARTREAMSYAATQ